ncbi:MAG: hypothetical protein J6X60_12580, partial [Ruminiclostridium sp.]|nr:hypothetical protein [Ruminiclostridium sp.]
EYPPADPLTGSAGLYSSPKYGSGQLCFFVKNSDLHTNTKKVIIKKYNRMFSGKEGNGSEKRKEDRAGERRGEKGKT